MLVVVSLLLTLGLTWALIQGVTKILTKLGPEPPASRKHRRQYLPRRVMKRA